MQIKWKDRTKVGQKPTASAKQRKKQYIPPGICGWPGCKRQRRHGEWTEGGSYMCSIHADILLPVRALFDKLSPDAVKMRKQIDAEAELNRLKEEEREEGVEAA